MLDTVAKLAGFGLLRECTIAPASASGGVFTHFVSQSVSTPGTSATVYNSTNSKIPLPAAVGGKANYITRAVVGQSQSAVAPVVYVVDRLTAAAGLSANVNTLQSFVAGPDVSVSTSNMAVRRGNADYSDVIWALEIWSQIGTTGSGNITITYTDGAGTPGQTTIPPASGVGGGGAMRNPRRMVVFGGPAGIQSVQSIQLTTATGAAGNIGVSAFRVLGVLGHPTHDQIIAPQHWGMCVAQIPEDACLEFFCNYVDVGTVFPYVDVRNI